MYCTRCGTKNHKQAMHCRQCGDPLHAAAGPQQMTSPTHMPAPAAGPAPYIPTHLIWAILATVFCCLPFGIIAIVFAAQTSSRLDMGDYTGARRCSDTAFKWCLAATLIGLLWPLIALLLWILPLFGLALMGA